VAPHLTGLAVEGVFAAGRSVHVLARTCASQAACPGCGGHDRWTITSMISGCTGCLT